MWLERQITPRSVVLWTVSLSALGILGTVLLLPPPWLWWPSPFSQLLPWAYLPASDRVTLAATVVGIVALVGLVLSVFAGIVQLRAFVPARQTLGFRAEPVAGATALGHETWRLRITNTGAVAAFFRIEVVVEPPPALFDAPAGWRFETAYESGHGADTWVLAQDAPLFAEQYVLGPRIRYGEHKHATWSIRWWTDHSGPHITSFGHGTAAYIGDDAVEAEPETQNAPGAPVS